MEFEMKKILISAMSLAALAVATLPASAADMRMPTKAPMMAPAFSWTGFYLGVHAGYGTADTDARWDPRPSPAAFNADPVALGLGGDGFVGGVHLGYNWQVSPQWLLGVEADWTWADLGDSQTRGVNFFGGAPAPRPARPSAVTSTGSRVCGRASVCWQPRPSCSMPRAVLRSPIWNTTAASITTA
jgi:outer membrane immunogenic protein